MSDQQRLHVLIAHAGVASRRQAEKMILEGRVTVNGRPAHIGQSVDVRTDKIAIDEQPLFPSTTDWKYILLHKPSSVVSTTRDEMGRQTVLDLLPRSLAANRLYPVGRLDADSEGLILLTNDGELAFRLTHPKYDVIKIYWTKLDHQPTPAALAHLKSGVKLNDGWAKPIRVQQVPLAEAPSEGLWWEIVLKEGRKHQVKRMWQRTGYTVERLLRVAIGPLYIADLPRGHFRELSTSEVDQLKKLVSLK